MTLEDLINELNELLEVGFDPQTKVLLATQPNWPLAFNIAKIQPVSNDEPIDLPSNDGTETTLWIVEGGRPNSDPYAPRAAWDG